ncbi:MAG: LptF/LptG family permease, partial [Nitrospirae bacterium]|nr:LptF/LptG family permease [Nitrospirota bacterium]
FQIPRSVLWASPFASLISILFTIGMAAKWKETIAVRAAGGSLKKVMSPFLMLGIIISIIALILGEGIVPLAAQKASLIRKTKILKEVPKVSYTEGVLWVKGLEGSLIRVTGFVEDKNRFLNISIFSFDQSFKLIKRIEADGAEWINNGWLLNNATVFDFERGTMTKQDGIVFTGLEEPKIFKAELKKPEEMNFWELYNYYNRLERAGFKNFRYVVDLYGKLAYPLVNFVMILFGVSLALNSRFGGGIRAAGLALIIIISYWLVFSISTSLGNTGMLPPALAPWVSPVLFGFAGGYMFIQIRE